MPTCANRRCIRLGLNNLSGLSNVLQKKIKPWRDAIQCVPGYDNWRVLTTGRRPHDPTRLLSSNRMRTLINELDDSGEFDLVLFDTPPVLGLADAALVAENCDGLILLVSLDRVDRSLPKESVLRIRSSGAPLLGVVTNALKKEKQSAASGAGKYGYAAYDTSAAYAHYANDETESQASNYGDSPELAVSQQRSNLKTLSNGNVKTGKESTLATVGERGCNDS